MNNKYLDLENARSKLELSLTASTATGSAFPREALGCDLLTVVQILFHKYDLRGF